jgi:cytoskeletal protein RodZ
MRGQMGAVLRLVRLLKKVHIQRCTSTFLHMGCIFFGWPKVGWTKDERRRTTKRHKRQASSTPEIQGEVDQRQEQDTGKGACVIVPQRDYYPNSSEEDH